MPVVKHFMLSNMRLSRILIEKYFLIVVIKEAKRLDENSAECANSNTPPQHIQSEALLHD